MSLSAAWATVLAALIAAFLGSWIGAIAALSRFKRERAFDRQLDWYERMIRALNDMAARIEIASTFQEDDKTPQAQLVEVWEKVQIAHIQLEAATSEAALYASTEAVKNCARISKVVQEVADQTEAFDLPRHPEVWPKLDLIDELPPKLQRATKPLAEEARRHLGIK